MIRLFVTVEFINTVMAEDYTHIRVYTDTSATGDFTTLDGTVALVADVESYAYTDTDGDSDTWYKTAYYGATPGTGDKSTARKGNTFAAYATVDELRAFADITTETFDLEMGKLLDGASRAIDGLCGRIRDGFVADPVATARVFAGNGRPYMYIDECAAISAVAVKDTATDSTYTAWETTDWMEFSGSPKNPDFNTLPYQGIMVDPTGDYSIFTSGAYVTRSGFRPMTEVGRGVPTVRVTARWGYALTVPANVKIATLFVALRQYKRLLAGASDTLASTELGELMYTMTVDPDVALLLTKSGFVEPAVA